MGTNMVVATATDAVTYWNDVSLTANKEAHTNPHDSEAGSRGPTGSSRAFAIVHLAMHDAYFGIETGIYPTYLDGLPPAPAGASADAAVAAAAHATLSALYPNQRTAFDRGHAGAPISGTDAEINGGHSFGLEVARMMLARRQADPSTSDSGYAASIARGAHRPDPMNPHQGYHAPFYGALSTCFAVTERHQLDVPPAIGSADYDEALEEVRGKGIAPELAGTVGSGYPMRTTEETLIGVYWGYDGAKGLGTPPRLYNQIVRLVAATQGNDLAANARLFALVNAAMGDAGILAWDEKYRHDLWRPVLGVREHDTTMGYTASGSGGFDDDCDPNWLPFGAPNSNQQDAHNFTPSFPAYPSGHATFGAAAFQATRRFYAFDGTDPDTLFDGLVFVSDELDGVTTDNRGVVRPRHAREFDGLWEMIEENGRSRVYLGVHWVFDAFAVDSSGAMDLSRNIGGVPLGLAIADDIADHGLDETAAAGPRLT